ncbi:MAG: LysR family transcriptional regulator [Microbacterium sp.]|uniref:LysR family transcriptional regulator n=1 Tax=Microbacterium sp. TaxID=51671 RepID=UPI0039E4C8DA
MPETPEPRIDANLIVTLDALLSERSVAAAAARLHVGESTINAALRRLRTATGDRLLVRDAGRLALTPTAEDLVPLVRDALRSVSRALEGGPQFDPRLSNRTFWISASGYSQTQLGAALARLAHRRAPGVRLRMTSLDADGFTLDTLFRRDVVLAHVGSTVTGLRRVLFEDELVVVVAHGHPLLHDGALDAAALAGMRLVLGTGGQAVPQPVASMFDGIAPLPAIAINVAVDHAIPDVVAGSEFMGIVPRRLIAATAAQRGLVVARTPLRRVPLVEAAHWHPSKRADPAIAWLVDLIEEAVTASGMNG